MSFVSSVFTWARTATKKSGKNTLAGGTGGGNSQLIKKHLEAGLPWKGPCTVTSGTFPGPEGKDSLSSCSIQAPRYLSRRILSYPHLYSLA